MVRGRRRRDAATRTRGGATQPRATRPGAAGAPPTARRAGPRRAAGRRAPLVAAVAAIVVLAGCGSATPTATTRHRAPTDPAAALRRALAAVPPASRPAVEAALRTFTASLPPSETPSCPDTLVTPAPTYPDGTHGLGVPFVAALSGGELLSGYHLGWLTKSHPSYPWGLTLTGVSGWVTGLLQVPSLAATVDPVHGIEFCDDTGLVPANLPAPAVQPRLRFDLVNDAKQHDDTQNYNDFCQGGTCPNSGFTPYYFTIAADPQVPPALSVAGVEPSGAIDLAGSTSVETSVAIWTVGSSGYQHTQTCVQTAPTTVSVGTVTPAEPAGAPPGATPQFTGGALQGGFPHAGNPRPATATLVGNGFQVPAFNPAAITGGLPCGAWPALDGGLSGFDVNGVSNYATTCTPTPQGLSCAQIASPPGYSQFTIKATIATLDLPFGVPSGFGF